MAACVGVARWKRTAIRRLLAPDGGPGPVFHRSASKAVQTARARDGAVGVWPSRAPTGLEAAAGERGVPIVQLEDGFLRSNGLGAECRPPMSLVADRRGMHYDPRTPSDLEHLLAETRFSADLLTRAQRLVARIVELGVTKYNLPGRAALAPRPARRTVLVTGQVEDDLSVRLGGAGVEKNLTLLQRVRELEPEACVLYRPHPDVDAGLRKGACSDVQALRFANRIVRDGPLPALLDQVDAVHVLTSLTGFEALLRGREVVAHGQPFFSGWGLTRDLAPPPRRGRRLSVLELAAAALILYPIYLDEQSGRRCSPERAVELLTAGAARGGDLAPAIRRMQGRANRLFRAARGGA